MPTYFTPIPDDPNQLADADTFNDPMLELDIGIGIAWTRGDDALSIAIANNTELVTARSTYTSLDARLDAITFGYVGGNIATLTNGAASAGQKNVTVDSTTGFLVGAYVAYELAGGAVEYNTIASITPTTGLTLTTNIGTGGIADDSYIGMISVSEYQAANAIPHAGTLTLPQAIEYANGRVFSVRSYGAKGDGSDDTAAFVAALAAAAAAATPYNRATVTIPAGLYIVDPDTLIVTNPYVSIKGDGFKVSHVFTAGPGVLLQWAPTSGAFTGVTGSISDLMFTNAGSVSSACIEVVNSNEVMIDSSISRCWFIGAIYTDTAVGIRGQIQATSIIDCLFESVKEGIVLNPNSANVLIDNCHFFNLRNVAIACNGSVGSPCNNINISNIVFPVLGVNGAAPAAISASYTNGLNVNNLHCYNVDNATFLLYGISLAASNRVNLSNIHIKNAVGVYADIGAALYITACNDVNVSNFIALGEASYRPNYGIVAVNTSHLFVNNFSISGTLQYGVWLRTSSTSSFHSGHIGLTGETTPATFAAFRATDGAVRVRDVFFTSDGTHSDYALDVADLDSGDTLIVDGCTYDGGILPVDESTIVANPNGKIQIEMLNPVQLFTANDATPSVAAGQRFKTQNGSATTITMFDGGKNGQQITVIIADSNTTIDFSGTNLKGNCGADWSPGSGDWLEGFFDGTNWYCSVHDCTA